MLKSIRLLVSGALIALGCGVYADVKPEAFHFKATLASGSESLRSVELPWSVMSNLLQHNQQDLQVFNAEQQAVPFAIRYQRLSKAEEYRTRPLNFFSMGDIEKLGTILEKEADNGRYKTIKLTQTGKRYLIIDNPKLDENERQLPLQSLTLNWENLNHWLPKSLKIEVSDNLAQWRSVSIKALPYRLSEGGTALENKVLSVKQPITQRFIRLSGAEDFEPLLKSLKSVSAQYQQQNVTDDLNWNPVSLKATDQEDQYQLDLPPSLPIRRWHLDNLTAGSLYKGQLSARYDHYSQKKNAQWRNQSSFLQYKLQTEAGLIESKPVNTKTHARIDAWRFDFDQLLNGDSVPQVSLGWQPMEVVFVAQGTGPFELHYGSHLAKAVAQLKLDGVLGQVTPEKVVIKTTVQLSEVTMKDDGSQYKYLLWGLLVAAVLMLLFMAKGLLKEME